MNWLEVSMTVNGELAEAVADVFARFAPNGVMTEQGVQFLDEEDLGTASGPITVRAYLPVDAQLEDRRQKLHEALYYLGRIESLPVPAFRPIADQNWMEAWKQHYRPIPIGKRLLILPAWLDSPEPDRIAIKIDPGMAFGTGTHPTTQLCLELMESRVEGRRPTPPRAGQAAEGQDSRRPVDESSELRVTFHGSRVIDVGCGSGILSIAALKLGAREALGVDIDPESIKNARENADTNGVGEKLVLGVGSVGEILKGKFPWKTAPLVMANILAPVIIRLFDAGLAELIEPRGTIILSGILQEQAGGVIAAGQARGLKLGERRQMGDWVAMAMVRPEGD